MKISMVIKGSEGVITVAKTSEQQNGREHETTQTNDDTIQTTNIVRLLTDDTHSV